MIPSITGSTDLYLIPGDPVTNVRLPRMFNAVFQRVGIDAVMAPVQVSRRDLAVFVKAAFLARNVHGMVIAPPHKPLLVDLLDGCGLFGARRGSVNVVRRIANGELEGDLFDGEGLIGALDHYKIPFRGKRVLVLGAGVSAAAIGVALAEGGTVDGAETIAFYDASAGKAAGVAAKLDAFFDARWSRPTAADPTGFDLVINATPLGARTGRRAAGRRRSAWSRTPRSSTSCCAASRRRWCRRRGHAGSMRRPASRCWSSRCRTTSTSSAFAMRPMRSAADLDFLRELIYPASMSDEIRRPLRYNSSSVA